jgi:hypothetical protein
MLQARFPLVLLALIALGSACALPVDPAPGTEASAASLFKDSARVLNITAHQDDDIFAFTPDLRNDIRARRAVRTVVFTAGDANMPCNAYVVERGVGQMLAWEAMAGVSYGGNWPSEFKTVAGKNVLVYTMPDATRDLSIVYVGLANNEARDLENLWNDLSSSPPRTITTLDTRFMPQQRYTREELIALVRQLIVDFAPTHLNLMDSGKTWPLTNYPNEHTDHVHSALFAQAALARLSPQPATLRMYRTYNAVFDVQNVAAVDVDNKHAIYNAYAPHDGFLCQGATFRSVCQTDEICEDPAHAIYGPFEHMQYPVSVFKGTTGVIRGPGNQCLRVNGSVAAGSTLSLGACTGSLPKWSLPADGTLRTGGLCASAGTGSDPSPAATRGASLRLEACSSTVSRQRFLLTGLGQLRGPDATCVSAATAGSLKLAECANDPNLLGFALNFQAAPAPASNATDFASVPDQVQYYGSLTYGDLDGDLDSDVCIRRADGVWCATNNAGTFGSYGRRTTAFRDQDGYAGAASGSTLQLADVDSDGRADLCARKDSGIYCARNTGTGAAFDAATKRSNGNDFGDLVGYGVDDTYYGSIRFVDVNNDKKLDVCGRNSSGIECATGSGTGSFAAVSQRQNVEFTDVLGWVDSAAGSTMQYADVDGDGLSDVCGRGADGMICMLGTGNAALNQGFERPHVWSNTGDFANAQGWNGNAAYYRSIHLGDVNGDGMADVCGRKADGVWCAFSTGQAFAPARQVLPADPFTDANYGSAANGGSLALIRLDGDTHTDVCLRGTFAPASGEGLRCALAL